MKTTVCALALGLLVGSPALATEVDAVLAERTALCARSVDLAGLRDDMDEKIAAIVNQVTERITPYAEDEKSVEAYKTALALALDGGKAVVIQRVIETCAVTFTVEELNGINAFYVSPRRQGLAGEGPQDHGARHGERHRRGPAADRGGDAGSVLRGHRRLRAAGAGTACSGEEDLSLYGWTPQMVMISARSSGMPTPFSDEVIRTRGKAAGRLAMAFRVFSAAAWASCGFSLSILVRTIW